MEDTLYHHTSLSTFNKSVELEQILKHKRPKRQNTYWTKDLMTKNLMTKGLTERLNGQKNLSEKDLLY